MVSSFPSNLLQLYRPVGAVCMFDRDFDIAQKPEKNCSDVENNVDKEKCTAS